MESLKTSIPTGKGNDLILEARRRVNLSQREFAEKVGTSQSYISRIEKFHISPSFDFVIRCLRLVGLDLEYQLVDYDDSNWKLTLIALERTPEERLEWNRKVINQFDALRGSARWT